MKLLLERIEKLEFQQKLLLKMMSPKGFEFDQLIIEKNLSEQDVMDFHRLCEELNKELKEQKAEGFVFYSPLFKKFNERLHSQLEPAEVIDACKKQKLYEELMLLLEQNI
ncbi:DUF1878 family protein [Falsibacillus albus]|uniref:DUF1878 family protein n=2 Tax=Falsibacillus albus TaxID=2478915 RepID=A0A3L7K5H8_9BACI|nr:DUF1878 family protein [Falsibacillus albus]